MCSRLDGSYLFHWSSFLDHNIFNLSISNYKDCMSYLVDHEMLKLPIIVSLLHYFINLIYASWLVRVSQNVGYSRLSLEPICSW